MSNRKDRALREFADRWFSTGMKLWDGMVDSLSYGFADKLIRRIVHAEMNVKDLLRLTPITNLPSRSLPSQH